MYFVYWLYLFGIWKVSYFYIGVGKKIQFGGVFVFIGKNDVFNFCLQDQFVVIFVGGKCEV